MHVLCSEGKGHQCSVRVSVQVYCGRVVNVTVVCMNSGLDLQCVALSHTGPLELSGLS